MHLADLIANYPRLFHMAEDGSWDSIKQNGQLSTSALLNLYGVDAAQRLELVPSEGRKAFQSAEQICCRLLSAIRSL